LGVPGLDFRRNTGRRVLNKPVELPNRVSQGEKMEKDLIEYIAKSLVDDPASVNVSVIEGEKSTILELRVAADDIGKVIGKHGRIAKAMRTVLQAATAKTGRHTVLEILD
jgi:predicted RNA-binding protein YlqC (UPF0109 family)